MKNVIDINEKYLEEQYPGILDILLIDRTTGKNLIWGTDYYSKHGFGYGETDYIKKELILKKNGRLIKPRIQKSQTEQKKRSKDMAEVFTPAWICNKQNNIVDNEWFGYSEAFNKEVGESWLSNESVVFIERKWQDYIDLERMEITCGEAPYLTSRYDVVTGNYIEPKNRIGLLDRKLIVAFENTSDKEEWMKYATLSYKRIYGFDFQGDNVLLARENLLATFIEFYTYKFGESPTLDEIKIIVNIISWNIWQMDGMKYVIPISCHKEEMVQLSLFDEFQSENEICRGCKTGNNHQHNGVYSKIKDWRSNRIVRFVDLIG